MTTDKIDTVAAIASPRALLELGIEVAGLGLGLVDYVADTITLDTRAGDLFSLEPGVPLSRTVLHGRIHPDDRVHVLDQIGCLLQPTGESSIDVQHRVIHEDGSILWLGARKKVMFGPADSANEPKPISGIVAIQDITELKTSEARIQLLLGEINHRSKNLLNVVQSIARMTARSGDPETFVERFNQRLSSLAANQDLMVHEAWTSVDLRKLIMAQLVPFLDEDQARLTLEGSPVRINADAAQAIGMAIHELATNATKHGALSTETGEVKVAWVLSGGDDRTFSMKWTETGGPPVTAPETTGFGQRVIKDMAASALKGEVELQYHRDGVIWTVDVPSEQLSAVVTEV